MGKHVGNWISLLFKWAIPRPVDILAKAWFFLYGVSAALVIGKLPEDQVALINELFRSSPAWRSDEIPIWAIAVLLFIYFVLEELLVQQAKLIWDDIRDRSRDRKLLHNKDRPIARGDISLQQALWNMVARLVFVILFIAWQRRVDLLFVFSLIFLHQALYLWAKPKGATHPLRLLLWLSFNNALRFLAGVVVIVGIQAFLPFILMFVTCYFCSVGGLAAQWKIEAEYAGLDIRPQSAYFAANGAFWQQVGLLNAILVAAVLLMYCLFSLCNVQVFLLHLTDPPRCATTSLNVGVFGGGVSLLWIGIFLIVGIGLVYLLQKSGIHMILAERIRKCKKQALLFFGGVMGAAGCMLLSSLFLAEMKPYAPSLLAVVLLVITIMYRIWYEGLSYRAFASVGRMEMRER